MLKTGSVLDRYFDITQRGSTFSREIRGGLATFFAMSYIVVLNPLILAGADSSGGELGFERVAAVTALVAGVAGEEHSERWAADIHRRTGGQPFFVREMAQLLDTASDAARFGSTRAWSDIMAEAADMNRLRSCRGERAAQRPMARISGAASRPHSVRS